MAPILVPGPIALAILGTYIFCCIFFVYYCLIAFPHDSEMAYFVQITLPNASWNRLSKICGAKVMGVLGHIKSRIFVVFYFTIVGGCWSIVFSQMYPWLLYESPGVSNIHAYIGIFVFLACFGAWALANASRPGFITSRSFRRFDHYPYDNLMFQSGTKCETTKLYRIPRSKYDRMKYDGIVPRYDHFCGWTHNTYGEENYRWFLLFLLNHVVMCFYGTYVSYLLFTNEIREKRLMDLTFFDRQTGETLQGSYKIVFQYMYARRTHCIGVAIVMFVMGIALALFLGYHVYITSMGQTTNENGKWSDVQNWYKKQQALYQKAVKQGLVPATNNDVESTDDDSEDGPVAGIADPGPLPKNIYNQGFVQNWSEVIFPLSLRKDALSRGGYTAAIIEQSKKSQTTKESKQTKSPRAAFSRRSEKPKDI